MRKALFTAPLLAAPAAAVIGFSVGAPVASAAPPNCANSVGQAAVICQQLQQRQNIYDQPPPPDNPNNAERDPAIEGPTPRDCSGFTGTIGCLVNPSPPPPAPPPPVNPNDPNSVIPYH